MLMVRSNHFHQRRHQPAAPAGSRVPGNLLLRSLLLSVSQGGVDFNDGQRQLQFCTDKCLNQYKMQLFCSEAISLGAIQNPSTPIDHQQLLITPKLWKTKYGRRPAGYHDDQALNLVKRVKLVDVDNATSSRKGKTHRPLAAFQLPADFPVWRHAGGTPSLRAGVEQTVDLTWKSHQRSAFHSPRCGADAKLNDAKSHVFPVLPPNFVMTPYPILIPLPIPVPIPIPIPVDIQKSI